MNILKSCILTITFLALIFLIITLYIKYISKKALMRVVFAPIFLALILLILVVSGPYLYGVDKHVEILEEIIVDISEEQYLKNSDLKWFSVYSKYGLGTPSRFNRDTIGIDGFMKFDENYTYLVSYGYQITHIKYNNWDLIHGVPILDLGTSPKKAVVSTSKEVNTTKLYIYKISRVRIDNDF